MCVLCVTFKLDCLTMLIMMSQNMDWIDIDCGRGNELMMSL